MQIKRSSVYALMLVFLLSACHQPAESPSYALHFSDATMGTSFVVKAPFLPNPSHSKELEVQIKNLLDSLDGQMSTYQATSELSQINNNHSKEWLEVSTSLYEVFKQAQNIAVMSQGAFDITVGHLVKLWGFGTKPMLFAPPSEDKIVAALSRTGFEYLSLNHNKKTIRKKLAGLNLDLSAIAKGYAVDQVGLLLESYGIVDYLVEIGGEIRLRGKNIHHQPWRIAIEKPATEQRLIHKVLALTDISLATSGDYRNFFEIDGARFSHTIDPRTGKPITHQLASVTILSDTTMKADALATALMVMGPERALKVADEEKIAAFFLIKTEDGFAEKASSEFISRFQ